MLEITCLLEEGRRAKCAMLVELRHTAVCGTQRVWGCAQLKKERVHWGGPAGHHRHGDTKLMKREHLYANSYKARGIRGKVQVESTLLCAEDVGRRCPEKGCSVRFHTTNRY